MEIDAGRRVVRFYLTRDQGLTAAEDPIWEVRLEHGEGLTAEVEYLPPKAPPSSVWEDDGGRIYDDRGTD